MDDPVAYLANEIDTLLGAGRVGLYEFPQFLRLRFPDLGAAEERRVSRAALARLIGDGQAKLVWARWTGEDYGTDATGVEPPDVAWDDIGDDPYLAVEPT